MSSRVQIADDVWEIMKKVYSIADNVTQSDRQQEFLAKVSEYVENYAGITPKKKTEVKKKV